jgi:hypothetical protein
VIVDRYLPYGLRFNLSCAYGLVAGGCVYSVM